MAEGQTHEDPRTVRICPGDSSMTSLPGFRPVLRLSAGRVVPPKSGSCFGFRAAASWSRQPYDVLGTGPGRPNLLGRICGFACGLACVGRQVSCPAAQTAAREEVATKPKGPLLRTKAGSGFPATLMSFFNARALEERPLHSTKVSSRKGPQCGGGKPGESSDACLLRQSRVTSRPR